MRYQPPEMMLYAPFDCYWTKEWKGSRLTITTSHMSSFPDKPSESTGNIQRITGPSGGLRHDNSCALRLFENAKFDHLVKQTCRYKLTIARGSHDRTDGGIASAYCFSRERRRPMIVPLPSCRSDVSCVLPVTVP
jgi:hypothetical protein